MNGPRFLTEELWFPKIDEHTEDLVAIGGDLSVNRLLLAYKSGIFPWFNPDSEFLWWSPSVRCVIYPDKLRVAKSMRPFLNGRYAVTYNQNFRGVIQYCSKIPRPNQDGTWITEDIIAAYTKLHLMGYAHSVEVWENDRLIGGLYGVSFGKVFFGESMFSLEKNASKTALISLVQKVKHLGVELIDCQMVTGHLLSLGASSISRKDFLRELSLMVDDSMQKLDLND